MQRDYFGAHTFRVLPGKENAKLKAGEDIRTFSLLPHIIWLLSSSILQTSTGPVVEATSLQARTSRKRLAFTPACICMHACHRGRIQEGKRKEVLLCS